MAEVIWMRVGDEDDYHEFDTLEDAAQHLADFYQLDRIDRYTQYGVCAQGFIGHNYISLYWGAPDPGDGSAEASRELTDEEIEEINESLEACADCGNSELDRMKHP
jgi:hypothetical protein